MKIGELRKILEVLDADDALVLIPDIDSNGMRDGECTPLQAYPRHKNGRLELVIE